MRLGQKLLLFVVAASVVPLAFAGFWLLREAERELSARLVREQRALAVAAAESAGTQLGSSLDALSRAALLIDWAELSADEAQGGLRLLLSQSPLVVAATLHFPSRPELSAYAISTDTPVAEREVLVQLLPLATLGAYGDAGQVALGAAQNSEAGPWMPAAIQVGPRGNAAPMVVVALTLKELDAWLVAHAPPGTTLEIVDADGRVISGSAHGSRVAAQDEARRAAVTSGVAATATEQLSAEKVPGKLGLTAVVSTPLDEARAPLRALRRSALGGMGATVALLVLVALLFAGRLSRRLSELSQVAQAFGRGELNSRVAVTGGDELTEVGQTFNAMGAELESSRARLLTWNDELKARVEAATADLRAAQARLLEAQKLAAIGQLGAGVAHEINNPLVGILGNAQLLLMETQESDDNFALLKQIEESALRCRDITGQLLRFSQKRGAVVPLPMDLVELVQRVAAIERGKDLSVPIDVEAPQGPVQIDGDAAQLEQVLAQLCANARTAMAAAADKRLVMTVRAESAGATLEVRDTGKGITPENLPRVFEPFFTTKDVWTNLGLGLAVAWRVMEEHEGRIEVVSEPGQGARFTLTFKAAGGTAQKANSAPLDVGGTGRGVTG